ncbi:MAG: glycosyltransferase family 4 protein [Prevotella sp.]|nr:glycosyltransferase family 4 protein [Prevotella sp.]
MNKTMLYINGRFLTQPMTGVERYAYNLCKAMEELHQPFTLICPQAPIQDCYDVSRMQIVHYGRGNSHFWEQCVLPFFFIGKKNYVVLSFTGLGSILVRNKVMTIHDLSFLENPRWFSRPYYWWYKVMTPLAVRTSKHIITVSEFSKREIMRFYPFLKEQDITVVYNAADESLFRQLPQDFKHEERFALAVSSLDPRKNFARLIEAFQDIPDCKLYIVGSSHRVFGAEHEDKSMQSVVHYLGRVSDEELVRLYNQAVCFIFPSLYEGFGLPPIEAMSCGCPVLVSDIPVLHEVCGDAATYFDPYNPYDIRKTIKQFLETSQGDRNDVTSRRHTRFCPPVTFSWEKSAKTLISLLKEKIPC